jgi:hypothetical protein
VLGDGRAADHIETMEKDKPADPQPSPETKKGPITRKEDLPKVEEIGGPAGPEPTRYGDWSIKGRVSDF